MSQKEICFSIIRKLQSEGKEGERLLSEGTLLLFDSFKRGEWTKVKGDISETEILRYSRSLLKNWMKKDLRINPEGYTPLNPRGSRNSSPITQEDQEKMMWDSRIKEVG